MSTFFLRTKVAVIRGGVSHGYDDSLKTGAKIISILRELPNSYEPLDIFISKEGEWHSAGLAGEPQGFLDGVDLVWNTLHDTFGDGGEVQRYIENSRIPYTGTSSLSSLIAMNKDMAKRAYLGKNLLTPGHRIISVDEDTEEALMDVFRNFMHPVIIKSVDNSFSGTNVVYGYQELKDAVQKALKYSEKVMVEEYIKGYETCCYVLENARDQDLYALVPTGNLAVGENKMVEELARKAHRALGLRHYSESKFVVTPKKRIYILGTNPFPHLHDESRLSSSLDASGWKVKDYVNHCIRLALRN